MGIIAETFPHVNNTAEIIHRHSFHGSLRYPSKNKKRSAANSSMHVLQPSTISRIIFLALALFPFALPTLSFADSGASGSGKDCVVLLHGLARTAASMNRMAAALQGQGYHVINIDYPSREKPIKELADNAVQEGVARCLETRPVRIHFVTHSLGGILVRVYLRDRKIEGLGRVVMLAPPNQGSRVVDEFSQVPGFDLLNGPAGSQLGTGADSVPQRLGTANFEVGIIAGDRSVNPILSSAFDEPNDGKVAVEDARLSGMKDFLVVHHSHPFIMQSDEVIDQVISFLENGSFLKTNN